MGRKLALVTGASGEIGQGLICRLAALGTVDIVAVALPPLPHDLARRSVATWVGDILDPRLLDTLRHEMPPPVSMIFHLAAILSTQAELIPETAQAINVQGTINLLQLAMERAHASGEA